MKYEIPEFGITVIVDDGGIGAITTWTLSS
jgi:hypothetical protein